ncbi:hypothetical protein VTJ49DRAFT_4300 [Mycothermus thermophilus]|uniref:NB-ARC domain-containing protein n=1 Tax=Humicola insolens TaxID=85995 RepID=A0ABR3V5R2_HUMIN
MASYQNNFGPGNYGLQVGQNESIKVDIHQQQIHLPPESSRPRPSAFIPFSGDPDFVNRGDILDRIAKLSSKPQSHTRVALVGFGGVGKSQLAIEYARRVDAAEKEKPDEYRKWIFWMHAGTRDRVEQGFRAIAKDVELPGREDPQANIPQLVHDWLLDERNGAWMIVIDSADDYDVFCAKPSDDSEPLAHYLPQSHNGSILITTRNMRLARELTGSHKYTIEVGPMAQSEAVTLLQNKLEPPPDPETADKLVEALGFVPLAISQAAAYIQKRTPLYSAQQYLADFPPKMSELLHHDAGDLRRDPSASNAILTTWQITFDHIQDERPSAADLLSLMSFFNPQGISKAVAVGSL